MLRDIADELAPGHTVRRRPAARCRGSTTNAALNAVTVGVLSAAIDVRSAPDCTSPAASEPRQVRGVLGQSQAQPVRSLVVVAVALPVAAARPRSRRGWQTDHTADSFAKFFDKKVRDVRSATAGLPPPPISRTASSSLASFRPCTSTEVRRIIMQSRGVYAI